MNHDDAKKALKDLLWELPAEFSDGPPVPGEGRQEFKVIKKSNVRKVHQALWELQEYFDINQPHEHAFIPGGPKNENRQIEPRPSCKCGAVMPVGIKTSPSGWYFGHTKFGWK